MKSNRDKLAKTKSEINDRLTEIGKMKAVTGDKEVREKYDALKQEMVLQLPDEEITAANAASLSGKLSQLANGAIYTEEKNVITVHDRKLDAMEDIIEAAAGKPILVAYWFQHDLQRITERLEALKVSYARISSPGSIELWNRGEFAVGLIHPASAGHGLNLQEGGSTLVWFGLTWSLELYQQTIWNYANNLRMNQAAILLRDTDCNIHEIAANVGYQSPAAFTNMFKNWCGLTPGQFRTQVAEDA